MTRDTLMGTGICFAIAFGALMNIFFGNFVVWLGLGMGVSAAVAHLVPKRTDRRIDSGWGVMRSSSFKKFLVMFFGFAILGAAGAIVSFVYAMHRAAS